MKYKRLSRKNAIYTTRSSDTTVLVNYEAKEKILEVEFTGGRVYHYLNVSAKLWQEYKDLLQAGGSSGKFVNTRIKPFYKYAEIAGIQ
jgi:hypothetical protein